MAQLTLGMRPATIYVCYGSKNATYAAEITYEGLFDRDPNLLRITPFTDLKLAW